MRFLTLTAMVVGAGVSQLPELPPEALGGAAVGLGTIALWRLVQLSASAQAYVAACTAAREAEREHWGRLERLGEQVLELLRRGKAPS